MHESLGIIEVQGLATAITIADIMAKAANIRVEGVGKARGFGWMTIIVTGNIGAVQAAIEAGRSKATESSHYISHKIIARPEELLLETFLQEEGRKSSILKNESEEKIDETITIDALSENQHLLSLDAGVNIGQNTSMDSSKVSSDAVVTEIVEQSDNRIKHMEKNRAEKISKRRRKVQAKE